MRTIRKTTEDTDTPKRRTRSLRTVRDTEEAEVTAQAEAAGKSAADGETSKPRARRAALRTPRSLTRVTPSSRRGRKTENEQEKDKEATAPEKKVRKSRRKKFEEELELLLREREKEAQERKRKEEEEAKEVEEEEAGEIEFSGDLEDEDEEREDFAEEEREEEEEEAEEIEEDMEDGDDGEEENAGNTAVSRASDVSDAQISLPLEDADQRTEPGRSSREMFPHPKPKYTYAYLSAQNLPELRRVGREFSVPGIISLRKDDLILSILKAQAESMNYRFGGGTLEILQEGFGFLRPKGMLPTDNDVYLSASQIRRFGLRNGDVIWGLIRPPRDQEHYEALLRVETVNFSDPEHARRRAMFSQLTPIFPNARINLSSSPTDMATRLVDMFAPIGFGQRALLVSPPKAGKTTLLKRIAKAISEGSPDVILMALLIDERPEEVTDISRSIDGEVIASTFDRPADEHIRVATLALEKAKRLVEVKRNVVILLDSITRLARASNLTVPPSGRTLSGGLDPSGLYFPKRFFGAARNFEEGGSLTIIGTALTDTGSRMDDVIYEEFKGTGNMELHLSRKLAEQRVFPAIDITRSGTRREELLIPEDELTRLWLLRKRLASTDEAGALNLILDKLKQTQDNHEFLMSLKIV